MSSNDTYPTDPALQTEIERLEDRLATIEEQLDALTAAEATDAVFTDPELAHKVVHACVHSDQISEDEELWILKRLLEPAAAAKNSDE